MKFRKIIFSTENCPRQSPKRHFFIWKNSSVSLWNSSKKQPPTISVLFKVVGGVRGRRRSRPWTATCGARSCGSCAPSGRALTAPSRAASPGWQRSRCTAHCARSRPASAPFLRARRRATSVASPAPLASRAWRARSSTLRARCSRTTRRASARAATSQESPSIRALYTLHQREPSRFFN